MSCPVLSLSLQIIGENDTHIFVTFHIANLTRFATPPSSSTNVTANQAVLYIISNLASNGALAAILSCTQLQHKCHSHISQCVTAHEPASTPRILYSLLISPASHELSHSLLPNCGMPGTRIPHFDDCPSLPHSSCPQADHT